MFKDKCLLTIHKAKIGTQDPLHQPALRGQRTATFSATSAIRRSFLLTEEVASSRIRRGEECVQFEACRLK